MMTKMINNKPQSLSHQDLTFVTVVPVSLNDDNITLVRRGLRFIVDNFGHHLCALGGYLQSLHGFWLRLWSKLLGRGD